MCNVPCRNCIYSRLPEDEPSGSKHVEDIKKLKIEILIYKMYISLICTVQLYTEQGPHLLRQAIKSTENTT